MFGLPVKNNTDRPMHISWNFYLSQVQDFIYPNIKQLHPKQAGFAKQAHYKQHKKAWLDKFVSICYAAYKK